MKKKGIGSSFDSFLKGEGIFDEVDAAAKERVAEMDAEDRAKLISENNAASLKLSKGQLKLVQDYIRKVREVL